MSRNDCVFVSWDEHMINHEKGSRVVHYYLKKPSGDSVFAVVGTERSIRHMLYVVSDEFLQIYGSSQTINACTKWRARRDVVDWLTSLVSKHCPPSNKPTSLMNESTRSLGSNKFSAAGFTDLQIEIPNQMIQVSRRLKIKKSGTVWSGDAWICCKQLKHYSALCRNAVTITVHSFAFLLAENGSHYVGYLEDLYEDKKGQKKLRVRWFHDCEEVKGVVPQLKPHPREVFLTPHVQVISAECIDGPVTILTPKHYEECLAVVPQFLSSSLLMCFRQFKSNMVKPYSLSKLRGYCNQAALSYLDRSLVSKQKMKGQKVNREEEEEYNLEDSWRQDTKRIRSYRRHERIESGHSGIANSVLSNQTAKSEPTHHKLRIKLSSKGPVGVMLVGPEPKLQAPLKVDEKIELLCQDSGMRGCWFRCKVLQTSQNHLKVQYCDVEDANGLENLEEWVPASRVAAPDKLQMRCSGRLTIRPCPPEDFSDYPLQVGAPVDAWWSDGWWEGVVTGVNTARCEILQVYIPGENQFLTVNKKHIRTSRDWINNRWVDIEAKPDILSGLSSTLIPDMKVLVSSNLAGASDVAEFCGASKRKSIEADMQELPGVTTSKQVPKVVNDEDEVNQGSSGNDNGASC